jgi:hypothetical protein
LFYCLQRHLVEELKERVDDGVAKLVDVDSSRK